MTYFCWHVMSFIGTARRLTNKCPVRHLPRTFSRCAKQYGTKTGFENETESASNTATKWRGVIGLEIHAQINSRSKLFSGSATDFGGSVNSHVSYLDAALPGTLPVINRKCVEAAVLTAYALNCKVHKVSKFDRKHYFYADLPAGYQITQQQYPVATDGCVKYLVYNAAIDKTALSEKSARIIQLQLEQDSGKSLHDVNAGISLIDLNRAGLALMEIVTEPDFESGEDAAAFIKELQCLLQVVGSCDGKMAEGSIRVDANISVHKPGEPLGVRSEVKNINSIRNVAKAIEFEINRQIKELENGQEIVNETRSFDMEMGETVPMRDKEKLQDYRFMPEPNLPPLRLFDNSDCPKGDNFDQVINIDVIHSCLPELPRDKRLRLCEVYNMSMENSILIVNSVGMADYFETIMQNHDRNSRTVLNLLKIDLLGLLNEKSLDVAKSRITAERFGEMCDLVESGSLSKTAVRKVLPLMFDEPSKNVVNILHELNLIQISDPDYITDICSEVLDRHPELVAKFKAGKTKVINKFVGEIMKKTGGAANPKMVNQTLTKLLSK